MSPHATPSSSPQSSNENSDGENSKPSATHIITSHPYRYPLLIGIWAVVTATGFYRVSKQPYIKGIKAGQYETILKATTLGVVLAGIGLSGNINKSRSAAEFSDR
jgi:hypothetical protein